jgi:hypothetical protein
MKLHGFSHETETETRAFVTGGGMLQRIEPFEDSRQRIIWNSWPVIGDDDFALAKEINAIGCVVRPPQEIALREAPDASQ